MNIGDLFLGLKVDPSGELKSQVTKAAADAGDVGGKTLGQHIGTALKGASVLIAGGLALATKGAMEAEAAQGRFMAATGKSREEAKQFVSGMDSLAGSAGTVGKSFEEIAATGTMVEQQFHTQGQETVDLTKTMLDYSKVAGGEAADNTALLEDTLSAYGKGAESAAGLTDMLVESSHEFGTKAGPESVAALQAMAPALTAMNEGLDYGVGALNLFEDAGVDATTGQQAFNKAVDNIPPGGSFDDIIAKLGAIEDPALKDAEAVKIFGERAGHKMALAIKPGMTSLDDYRISMDDAAGATSKASEDMLTFSDRIQGFVQKGLAGLREVGQQFGPVVTALGSMGTLFGPAIGKSLGAGWELAMKNSTLQNLVTSAGGKMGGWMGVGLSAAAVVAVAAMAEEIGPPIGKAGEDLGRKFFGSFGDEKEGLLHDTVFDSLVDGVHSGIDAFMDSPLGRFNIFKDGRWFWMSPEATADAEEGGTAAGTAAATATAGTYADQMREKMSVYGPHIDPYFVATGEQAGEAAGKKAAAATATSFADDLRETRTFAGVATVKGHEVGQAFALGLAQTQGTVQSAFGEFKEWMKHPMTVLKEQTELEGELTSKALQKGLKSEDPLVRARAEAMRDQIQDRLDDLQALAAQDGDDASGALGKHLDGTAAVNKAIQIASAINAQLNKIDTHRTIFINRVGTADTQAGARAAGGPVKKNKPYIVGERPGSHFGEWFVPESNGYILPHGVSPGTGGDTYNIPINVYDATDPQKVGSVVADKLERIFRGASVAPLNRSARPAF